MAGTEQLGKYLLLERIGVGGMAEVWLARSSGPGGFSKACVVKTVRGGVNEERFRRMFMDEARLAAILNHPNIVQVFDFGEDQGRLYIAMEYILGRTLRALMKKLQDRRMQFPLEHAARVVSGVLEGLDHAHAQVDKNGEPLKIIHRDVSPDNIMVSYSGVPKLLDFGIAKATLSTDQTRDGRAKGKLLYMAPEQLTGSPLDHRVDIYAAGVVLFEVCCGQHPFPIPNPEALAVAIVEREPPHPQSINPSLPDEMADIIVQCLRKDPVQRFPDARAMLDKLEYFLQTLTIPATSARLDQLLCDVWKEEMAEDTGRARRAADVATSSSAARASLFADGEDPDTVSDLAPRGEVPPQAGPPNASSSPSRSRETTPPRPPPPPTSHPPAEDVPAQPPMPPLPPGESVLTTGDREALARVFASGTLSFPHPARGHPPSPRDAAGGATVTMQQARAAAERAGQRRSPGSPGDQALPPGVVTTVLTDRADTYVIQRGLAWVTLAVVAVGCAALSGAFLWVAGLRVGFERGMAASPRLATPRLAITSDLGCVIRVDGLPEEQGPTFRREMTPGPHTVEVRCPGGHSQLQVNLEHGRDVEVMVPPVAAGRQGDKGPGRADLPAAAQDEGYIVIQARKATTVYLDGRKLPGVPTRPLPTAAGPHLVRVVFKDGREQVKRVDVLPGRTTTVKVP